MGGKVGKGDRKRRDRVEGGWKERVVGETNFSGGAPQGQDQNLVQWKLPGIYKHDWNKVSEKQRL